MTQADWKSRILTRRAGFLAVAVATVGAAAPGCKEKLEVVTFEPLTCLSVRGPVKLRGEEGSPGPDTDKSFAVQRGDKLVLDGSLSMTEEGGPALFRAGRLMSGLLKKTQSCIVDALERGDDATGTVEVLLDVDESGTVADAKGSSTGKVSDSLRDCLGAQSKGFVFPTEGAMKKRKVVVRWTLKRES